MLRLAVPLALTCLTGISACISGQPSAPSVITPDRAACTISRVIDGDTVDLSCPDAGRFRARLTGYDTPETFEPRCYAEARLGQAATDRLRAMVQAAQTVDARIGGFDRYDRRLVGLSLDGRDVGATLVAEGLALRYTGGRRPDWCARLT